MSALNLAQRFPSAPASAYVAQLPLDERSPADPQAEPISVLYVEDHPVNVLLMQELFRRRPGLKLVVAIDGGAALRAVATLQPALLLLDLGLPDCHGSELLAALRRLPQTQHAPAVAVTADDVFDVTSAGFIERWLKPLELGAVLRRLDELCPPGMTVAPQPLHRYRETRPAGLHDGQFPIASTSTGDH